ncbi:hypothetical protein GOP47_0000178 [Adiantum capillus-veneris]|uniref:Arginyl-tRNA--protein transferase n=1 Tax=Adiantum capillus-veneris TaxID=13818 RepID=A0A9D4ZQB8_ADICA|nr:hypothetical protein GOP47_0000178 [Adiantum capillus-veneris]
MAKRNKERGEPSVVEDQGLYASSCGYCKSDTKTSVSYGLWAHSLSVYDYQDLLDRGWRRSGMFLYKPEMNKTCCPAYTIRLKADSFCPSKEQNRVMHRMQRYLDGSYTGPASTGKEDSGVTGQQISAEVDRCMQGGSQRMDFCDMNCDRTSKISNLTGRCNDMVNIEKVLSSAIQDVIIACCMAGHLPADLEVPRIVLQKLKPTMRKRIKTSTTGEVVYSCNVSFLVAAALSKHKEVDTVLKNLQQSQDCLKNQNNGSRKFSPLQLAELFASRLQMRIEMHDYVVEACNGHLNFLVQNRPSLDVASAEDLHPSKRGNGDSSCSSKPQTESSVSPSLTQHLRPKRILEVRMRRSAFDPEEFALYKRYQIAVHHDKPEDVKESSFVRFLVNSPLNFVPPSRSGTAFCGFGSFHQQYLIDGRLIAVGVVDILPSCLSSKYLFWDPDFAFLSLGKYSALQEIQWVQKAQTVCSSLEYYYLGYYIHTCPKMRYKGAYRPSELLCPVKFQWVPFDIAEPLLNIQPFLCLSDHFDETIRQTRKTDYVKDTQSAVKESTETNTKTTKTENLKPDVSYLSGAGSSSKESEDVNNILLKLGNQFLQFKRLQTWTAVPQKFKDALACDLRKYSQVVGHVLASKMAYVLD